jgi:hypothetical protein
MGTTLHVYTLVFKFITLFLFFTPNNNIVFDFEHLHMQWDIHEIASTLGVITKMDHFKKQQCFVTLKRLMKNSNEKYFQNAMNSTDIFISLN